MRRLNPAVFYSALKGFFGLALLAGAVGSARATYNQSQAADLVVGQPDFTSTQSNNSSANGASMNAPAAVFVVTNTVSGSSFTFVADTQNNRVLIFKSSAPPIGAIADYVLGQPDAFKSNQNYDGVTAYTMNRPSCVFSDGTKLFVCDSFNNRVLVWNTIPSTNTVPADVVIGQTNFSANSAGTSATTLNRPFSVIVYQGKLYIADTHNNRVLVYNSVPTSNGAAADTLLGQTLMSGCVQHGQHYNCAYTWNPGWNLYNNLNNAASADSLYNPTDVFIDTNTNTTYVSDLNNNRILVYLSSAPAGLRNADYVLGQPDMTANECNYGGSPTAQTLCNPRSVWANGSKLVVADMSNHRILVWNLPITQNQQPADYVYGQINFNSNGCRAQADGMCSPMDAYYDQNANQFFVADWSYSRVIVYSGFPTSNAPTAAFVLGQNTPTTFNGCNRGGAVGQNTICNAAGVHGDGNGNLYVGDNYNYRVLVYSLPIAANTQNAAFVLGQADFTTRSQVTGGSLTSANMGSAVQVQASTSALVAADPYNSRLLVWSLPITANGQQATYVLGQTTFNVSGGNNGGLSASSLNGWWDWPGIGVSFSTSGLVVADPYNNRVLFYQEPLSNGKAASQVLGQPAFNYNEAIKRAQTNGTLAHPQGLSAANNQLYVADKRNSRILVYDLPIPTLATIQAQRRPVAAKYVIGQSSFTFPYASIAPGGGSGNWNGVNAGTLNRPHGVWAVEGSSFALYVTDHWNYRTLVWTSSISANGQLADRVLGQSLFSSNQCNQNGTPNSNTQCGTNGQPWADANSVFIADGGRWRGGVNNNRVLYWSPAPTSNGEAAVGVLGQPNFTSNSTTPGASPYGLWTGSRGGLATDGNKLAVADSLNHRVLIFDPLPEASSIGANYVIGQTNMSGNAANNGGIGAASMNRPQGVHWDGSQFFVADTMNARVLVYNGWPTATGQPANYVIGQNNFTSGGCWGSGFANGLCRPHSVHSDGKTLWVGDQCMVKAFALPITGNAAPGLYVLGAPSLTVGPSCNYGGSVQAWTINRGHGVFSDGDRLYVGDRRNYRFLIYSPIPSTSTVSASLVAGQGNFQTASCNSNPGGQILCGGDASFTDGKRQLVTDTFNNVVRFWNNGITSMQQLQDGNLGGGGGAAALSRPTQQVMVGNKLFILDSGNNRLLRYTSNASSLFQVAVTSALLPSTLLQGAPTAGFKLVANAPNSGFPVTWTSLKLYNNGALPDSSLQARLYKDTNSDGVLQPGSDTAIGSFITFSGGKAQLNFSQPLDTNFATYFVAVQAHPNNLPFGPNGFPNASIRLFHNFVSFGFSNAAVEMGGRVPVGLAYNSGFATPVDDPDYVVMSATSALAGGASLLNNATGVVMAQLTMQTTNDWAFMNTVVVNKAGSADDGDIAGMTLWLDANGNGALEPGIDTNIMSSSLTFGGGQAFLSPTSPLALSTTPTSVLIVADFAGSANNTAFGISLDATSPFLHGVDLVNGSASTMPFSSPLVLLRPAIAYATATVATSQWWSSTFTIAMNTGSPGVTYFRALMDNNAGHAWTDTEPRWNGFTSSFTPTGSGQNWYFHLRGYNGSNMGGNTIDLGPFWFDNTGPAGTAFRHFSSTGGAFLESEFVPLASGVTAQITIQDGTPGLSAGEPSRVWPSGAVGAWNFEEGSGAIGSYAYDLSGSTNHLVWSNAGGSWAAGRVGSYSADLDGTSYIFSSGPAARLPLGNAPRTFAAWVYPTGYSGNNPNMIVSYGSGTTNGGLWFALTSPSWNPPAGRVALGFYNNDVIASMSALPLNAWSHVAASYDGAWVRFYVDGVLVSSTTLPNGTPSTGSGLRAVLGAATWNAADSSQRLVGRLDDVLIYPRALSRNEVLAMGAVRPMNAAFSKDGGYSWTTVTSTTPGLSPYMYWTGGQGATSAESLKVLNMPLIQSTRPFVCAGAQPCSATNQVRFSAADDAGNLRSYGPYAILVDTTTPLAAVTPSDPANTRFINFQPNFTWLVPSAAIVNGLGPGSSYLLEVANGDPAFGAGNIVIRVSTPAVAGPASATYVSTFTLASGTTYYWRVQAINGLLGTRGPWSPTYSFVTDFVAPVALAFTKTSSTGGVVSEGVWDALRPGATAHASVQDLVAGLGSAVDAVPVNGLRGWWRMESNWNDSSPSGNNGTPSGSPTFAAGARSGAGGSFDGSSSIDLGNPSSLQITGSQTIAFWIKPTDFALRRNPYAKAYGGEGTITVETDGTVNYFYGTAGGNSAPYQGFLMSSALTAGVWTHLAIVRDLSSMQLYWYKNGILVDQTAASYAAAATSSNNALIATGYTNPILGSLDEMLVYNRALSASEVQQAYYGTGNYYVSYSTDAGTSFVVVTSTLPNDGPYVALTGADGSTAAETLTGYHLPVAKSTNVLQCGGAAPCAATNQVKFTFSDRAGNTTTFGPFALLVDTPVDSATPTLVSPANGGYTGNPAPTFSWLHPGATIYPGLTAYYLEVSSQPSFNPLTISISSPITPGQASSQYVSTTTLAAGTTYYWRVRVLSFGGKYGPYSPVFTFQTDFVGPAVSNYAHLSSTGGALADYEFNDQQAGVTARVSVVDALTGLNLDGPPDAATLALYQFETGVGNQIINGANGGNPAYFWGGANWTGAGRWGKGAYLPGSPAYVAVDSATAGVLNDFSGNFTVQLWVKPDATLSSDTTLIHKGDGNFGWTVAYRSGQLMFGLQNGTALNCGTNAVCVNTSIGGGQWNFVAGTYNGVTMALYLNGQMIGSVTNTGGYGISGDRIFIGSKSGVGEHLTGTVDDVRLYAYPRSAAEIASEASGASPPLAMFSNDAGRTWQVTAATYPVTAGAPYVSITGATGTQAAQTFELRNVSVVQSTSTLTGAGATNQVKFMLTDVAGNFFAAGPYSILFDSASLTAIATPTVPLNGAFVIVNKPTFYWKTASLATVVQYQLQVDDDPAFTTPAVNIATPAIYGLPIATYTTVASLAEGATYYWRVQARTNLNRSGPWSAPSSFVTDYTGPSTSSFATYGSTGGLIGFGQFNDLATGVTAQLLVRDLVAGLDGGPEQVSALIGRWRFEEGAGTTALDFTGQRDGTLTSAGLWGTGKLGAGLSVSGGNYVSIPSVSTSWNGMTVSAWMRPTVAGNFQTMWSSTQYQFIGDGTGGTARFYPRVAGAGGCAPATGFSYALNTWWHVTFVVDPGANQNRIYVNGQLAASCSGAGTPANTPFRFGIDGLTGIGGADGMTGGLDEFMIAARVLTDAEIQAEADALSFYTYNVRYSTNAGSTWTTVRSTSPSSGSYIALSGAFASTAQETMKAIGLQLVQSTRTTSCAGSAPCSATNQIVFSITDRAGNTRSAGPFSILVDTTSPVAISTPSHPSGGVYVNTANPTFLWTVPSTITVSGLTTFALEASNDPGFSSIPITISTPNYGQTAAAYASTYTLSEATTYYWRVRARTQLGNWSPYSQTGSFIVDVTSPVVSAFGSYNSTGTFLDETLPNDMSLGATVQLTIQDANSGLTAGVGFSVQYSTTAGAGWVDSAGAFDAMTGTGETDAVSHAQFGGRLYVGLGPNAKLYSTTDGQGWSLMTQFGSETRVSALAAHAGKLYAGTQGAAKIYSSANGTIWSEVFAAPGGSEVTALASHNGRVYAGVSPGGKIYSSADGAVWRLELDPSQDSVTSLLVFDGKLYAATSPDARVWRSFDGVSWNQLSSTAGLTWKLAAFNGRLYAASTGSNAKVYRSNDGGASWIEVFLDASETDVSALGAYGGKLYAGTKPNARLYVSVDGSSWGSSAQVSGETAINALVAFADQLFAATSPNGKMVRISRVPALQTGADGQTSAQTLSGVVELTQSTNTTVCAGVSPCSATNQIRFTIIDRAGNSKLAGPFAVIVDTVAARAQPIAGIPDGFGASSLRPEFSWGLQAAVDPNAIRNYQLDLAASLDFVSDLIGSSVTANRQASFLFNLTNGATYYWRARAFSVAGATSAWSATQSIFVDTDTPSGASFQTFDSLGNAIAEPVQLNLNSGVTAQLTIQDATGGIQRNGPAPHGPSTWTVVLWHLDEGAGGIATDAGFLKHDGILLGSPVWTTGRHAKALRFDGTGSQYVHFSHLSTLEPSAALTVSAWINTVFSGWVLAKGDAGGVSYGLRVETDGTPTGVLGGTSINCASVKVNDGRWHMLAATVGSGAGRVYVDGVECAAAGASVNPNTANLRVAQRGDGSPPYFGGAIDEVRVLRHAATAAQIAADYATGTPFTVLISTSAGATWQTITSTAAGAAPYVWFGGSQLDTSAVSLQARQLSLAASTNGVVCGGVSPCGATNQLRFVYADRAGNVRSAGPFAVLVDTAMSQPFAVTPPDQAFVSSAAPVFSWTEALPVATHQVQLSTDNFATVNVSSTVTSLTLTSPWALTHATTYYWRVRGIDAIGLASPFSPTHRFVVDLAAPTGAAFGTITSTGGLAGESQFNDLAAGVTAQLTVQDLVSGLAGASLGLSAPDAGTVGLWRFDEGAGSSAADISGQGNNGLLMGGAAWVPGRIKTGIGATGVQEVRVAYAASLNTPSAMTIEAWIKTSNTNAAADGQAVVTRWNGSSGFMLTTSRTGTGGRPAFYAGVGSQWLVGAREVADGRWHHIAATYDGTTAKLFVDGVYDGSAQLTNGLANTSTPLSIGTAPNDLQAVGFTGTIDDVRLTNYARTAAQVQQAFAAGVGFYAEVSSNTGSSFTTIFATAPAGSAPYVIVSGVAGSTGTQTLEARNLSLAQSASAAVCAGADPCAGATNQIKFYLYDRAGNLKNFGPYAILVDTQLSQPVAGSPGDGRWVSTTTPTLSWWEKTIMPIHFVELSTSSTFASLTYSTTTSLTWTRAPQLTPGATYYWRVKSQNAQGLQSGFSTANVFYVDASTPIVASARVLNSTGGVISEAQFTTLAQGVTALASVQDPTSGLALSISSYSVMYSTNGGASWIDHSSVTATLSGTGETYVTSLVAFNARLYAGTIPSARVYSSADGRNWSLALSGTGESQINALAVFKGRIYAATYPAAKVLSSADGTSWSTTLSGTGETDVRSLAVFNNRLYAGLSSGRVYATTDGSSWQQIATLPGVNFVDSLVAYNGRLYAGTQPGGTIYSTPDGFNWTSVLSGTGETRVLALAVYNGALFAGTGLNAKVYRTLDGVNWTQVYQAAGESNIHALAAANGKLYAGSSLNGRLHATPNGLDWAPTSLASGQSNIQSLAAFNGRLYLGTYGGGRVLEAEPLRATLSGTEGSGSVETLTGRDLNFVQSASTATCGGVWGCSATQQIVFSAFDRAGNAGSFGPYAVLVDSSVPRPVIASLTPLTTESIRVDVVPVVDGLSGLRDYQYYLSSSPAFAAPVSTTAFMASSTHVFTGLQQVTTYYVRVVARDNMLNISPYSISAATATNGVMFFSTADVSVPTVMQGLSSPMMTFMMSTLPGPAAVFNRVTVTRVGGADSDVSQAQIWKDADGDGVYGPSSDIQLAAAPFSGGKAVVDLGANAQNVGTSTMTFFVVYRFSPTATIGAFLAAQLDDFSAIGFGNSYRVPGTFPMTTASSEVLDGPNELLISPLSQAPTLAAPGTADLPMLRLRMQTAQGTSVLSKVVLSLLGTVNSNDISAVRVYRDSNSNGVFDAGTDGLVTNGNDVFTSRVSTLAFAAQTSSITVSPSLVDYFITFNVAGSAASGNTFGVALDTGTLVTLTGPDTGYLTVLPASSTLVEVVQPNTLTFSAISTTPGTVYQGDEYAVLKATLSVDQAFAKLAGVTVNRTGSSLDSDVSRVSIWLNQAPPELGGYFNPAVDLMLGTAAFSGGKAAVSFSPITLNAGATNVIHVVYRLNPLANAGNTIGASLTNSSYLSIVSTATTIAGTFPFGSSTATINATINTMLIPTAQDVTTGGLLQGATSVAMVRLDVRTDRNALTWSGLNLTKTGTAPDSAVSRIYVYADSNGNFQLDAGTDTRVSSGLDLFAGGSANITFPAAQAIGVSSQTFFIALSIDPLAPAGETVGVSIATTAAFSLSAPNVVSSQTASFPISGGPVPIQQYPNSITVSTASIAPASAPPGAANVGLLKLTLNTDVSTARWSGLKLDRVGAVDADVASVKVYYDINQIGSWNASQAGNYLLITSTLSTFGSDGTPGTVNLAFSTVAVLTTTPQTFYVVVDVAAAATPGDIFAGRILNQNYFTVNAPNAVLNTSAQSANVTVATPPSLMTVTAVSSAPAAVTQSDTNVPILRLSVAMQQYSGQWSGLTVLRQGSSSDSDVARVKLYYDFNANGTLDPLLDTLVGTSTFVTGQAALSFNSVQTVTTIPRTYFLAYDIAPVATANGTVGASIGGPGSFNIAAPNGVLNSGFPVSSGLSTINATQAGVFVLAQDKAPAALMQGATSQVMISLQMNTTQYSVLWSTLQLERLGSAADADVTAIRVYRDANADGLVDAGDQELTSGNDRFLSGVANLMLGTPQQIDTSPKSYLVAVDVYMFAASTNTLGVRISSAGAFGVPSPNFVVNTGFPVSTSQSPIVKRPDTMYLSFTDLVPSGINQGVELPMAKIVAYAQRDYVNWVQLRLLRQGSLSDGFINSAKIYLDANNSNTFDAADVQIGSGTVASGVANLLFGSLQRVTPAARTYFVTFVYDVNSTVGATVGFSVPDPSYVIVRSPDGVSSSSMPFATANAAMLDARTPTMPIVTPDGPFTSSFEQLHFVWGSTVALGQITNVTYAVGTAPGGSDTYPWTTLNPIAAAVNIRGLALQTGTTYYISVRAQSSYGFISPTGVSAPILVDLTVPSAPSLNATVGQVSVLLNWTQSSAGPSGLLGYLLEYRTGASPQWRNAKTGQPSAQGVLGLDEYQPAAMGPTSLTAADVVPTTTWSMIPPSSTVFVRVSAVTGAGMAGASSAPMRLLFGTLKPGEISDVSSYPNPFDSRKGPATINYTLPSAADVTIKIFSVYGNLIKTMSFPAGGRGGVAGANDVQWDGTDTSGRKTSKGIYLAVITSGGAKATHKIALIH